MRKKGHPAYPGKSEPSSYYLHREMAARLKRAERRTGFSRSDIITHALAHDNIVDTVTREDLLKLSIKAEAKRAAEKTA